MRNMLMRHLEDVAQSNAKVKVIFPQSVWTLRRTQKTHLSWSCITITLHSSVYLKELPLHVSKCQRRGEAISIIRLAEEKRLSPIQYMCQSVS